MVNIATLAEHLKIFSYDNGRLSEKACGNSDYRNGGNNVVWTGNGLWTCAGPDNTGKIPIYKYQDEALLRMQTFEEADASVASFLRWTNKEIFIGTKSGAVNIWDTRNKKLLSTLCQDSSHPIVRLATSLDDSTLAAATPNHVKLFELAAKRHTSTLELSGVITDLQFSTLGKNILGGCTVESKVYVWDICNKVPILDVNKAHAGACSGIAMSPVNEKVLASASLAKTVKLHDTRKKEPVLGITLDKHLSSVDMVLSHTLALGTLDGFLLILDLRNSEIIDRISAHTSAVTSLRTAPTIKPIVETVVCSPDEGPIRSRPAEASITDIISPIVGTSNVREIELSPMLSVERRNISFNIGNLRKSTSPFDLVKQEMRRRASYSTPIVGLNETDSFINMIATPQSVERTSSFNSEAVVLVSPPQSNSSQDTPNNGTEEITSQLNRQLPLRFESPPSSHLLENILVSVNALRSDVESIRSEVEELREEMKSIRNRVEDNSELILNIGEEVSLIPYYK